MNDISRDPITKAIYGEIKEGIKLCIDNECLGSAIILVLSGIDAMAYLSMPAEQEDVTKNDFVTWVEKYIRFPCKEQLTGLDLYGARCAMLHSFGAVSKLSREGKCRMVGYMDKNKPEVIFNPEVSKKLVLVSVAALAEAFFRGIDKFLVDLFKNPEQAKIAEKRLNNFVQKIPRED
ncbi:MAG: hypothetical protein WC486_00390 [Candidatus Omnitrophota bacterium]